MIKYQEQKKIIRKISHAFLRDKTDFLELRNVAEELFEIFVSLTEINDKRSVYLDDIYTPNGKAIGTLWAGKCTQEFMRTQKFLRGIYKAIQKALDRFEQKPIHILYAGSGPFGTLLIPLMFLFSEEEIQVTFLDINRESIKSLKKMVEKLNLQRYVVDIICCDATNYKINQQKPVHIIVTETMQNGLKKEPQVAITRNLVPQLVTGGILIPESICITANLVDAKKDFQRLLGTDSLGDSPYHTLGTVLELNQDNCNEDGLYDNICIEMPKMIEERFKIISLFTDIRVFEDEVLSLRECSLNLPIKLVDIRQLSKKINGLVFRYRLDENPRFEYDFW